LLLLAGMHIDVTLGAVSYTLPRDTLMVNKCALDGDSMPLYPCPQRHRWSLTLTDDQDGWARRSSERSWWLRREPS